MRRSKRWPSINGIPTLVYFTARERSLWVREDANEVVSRFENTPDKPVRLTSETGAPVFLSWRTVAYLEAQVEPE